MLLSPFRRFSITIWLVFAAVLQIFHGVAVFSMILYHRIAGIFGSSFAVIVAAASPISGQNLAAVVAVISPALAAVSLSIDL